MAIWGLTFKESCPDIRNRKVYDMECIIVAVARDKFKNILIDDINGGIRKNWMQGKEY